MSTMFRDDILSLEQSNIVQHYPRAIVTCYWSYSVGTRVKRTALFCEFLRINTAFDWNTMRISHILPTANHHFARKPGYARHFHTHNCHHRSLQKGENNNRSPPEAVMSVATVAAQKTLTFPFRPVQMEVKWPFCAQKNGNGTGSRTATDKRWNVQSTIPIVASIKKTPGESKKHRSIQAIAYGSDQSWLATRGQSIIDSGLQSQLSLNRRTRPKSKSGSRTLPQKTLEDSGSIKLSILGGKRTSWLSSFTCRQTTPIIANCTRVHKQNG